MNRKALQRMIEVGKVKMRSPVWLASGTCGYGVELRGQVDFKKIGGLIAKSVTALPRAGNSMPRVAECAAGMLNSIGLANVGLEEFIHTKIPEMKKLPCAIMANVAGSDAGEYVQTVRRLDSIPELAGLEINVSCPNVKSGGIEFGRNPKILEDLIGKLRKATSKPLWVKLSPNVTDIREMARAAEAGGADAISAINTLIGMRFDISKKRPVLSNRMGGYSGPGIKPVALYMVYQIASATPLPVIGMGGIESTEDAIEFFLAGAKAIQVGTATFRDPKTAENISRGLQEYFNREKIHAFDPGKGK